MIAISDATSCVKKIAVKRNISGKSEVFVRIYNNCCLQYVWEYSIKTLLSKAGLGYNDCVGMGSSDLLNANEKNPLEQCFHFYLLNVDQAVWEDNYIGKYEQSVNMPKNFRKTVVIRRFRQIPAKMRLGSQCLCGVSEGTVEMKEARLGRWHQTGIYQHLLIL